MTVSVELRQGCAWVRFGSGEKRNALTAETRAGLLKELTRLAGDDLVRAVVLAGVGENFCAGQDLAVHHKAITEHPEVVRGSTRREFSPIIETIARMPKPVIACLRGAVAGAGLGLALASDLRIVAADTKISTAFTAIALGPDSSVSYFLPRYVGVSRATEYLLRPRIIRADEAVSVGLAHEMSDPVEERVAEIASELAAGPTLAFAAVKETLAQGWVGLSAALAAEADWQEKLVDTRDHLVAVEAFMNKARPSFEAR